MQAGTVIPGALITGIRSDLPGEITAQVTENVYDSPTGRSLLIPQGSRLIGSYDSQVAFGQSRVLLVWTRLIMPSGKSIVLERQPGADTAGYSGLEDEVDNHWGMLFKAAVLSTLLSVGSEAGTNNNENALVQAIAAGRLPKRQPDRPAGRRPLSQHPADADDPAGISGARDRQPRPRIPLAEYEVICRAVDNAEFPVHLLPFPHISEEVSRHSSFKQKPAEVVFPMNRACRKRRSRLGVEGPLAPYLELYAEYLADQRYSRVSYWKKTFLITEFSRWLSREGISVDGITTAHEEAFLRHRSRRRRLKGGDRIALSGVTCWLRKKASSNARHGFGRDVRLLIRCCRNTVLI